MKAKQVSIEIQKGPNAGQRLDAELIVCPDPECESEHFSVYMVAGHQHIQCAICETTYCGAGGDCALEPEEFGHEDD